MRSAADCTSLCAADEFEPAPDWSRWWLGDSPSNPKNTLNWIVLKDNIRRLYICDRMILVRVSWQDLFDAGYVDGIKVVIDGKSYKCRLMSGGNDFHVDNDSLSGGYPTDNEWDRFVSGGEKIKGLPSLTSNDKIEPKSQKMSGKNGCKIEEK